MSEGGNERSSEGEREGQLLQPNFNYSFASFVCCIGVQIGIK